MAFEIVQSVCKRVLVPDDVTGGPPRRDVGVLAVSDRDVAEPTERTRLDVELEFIHPLEIRTKLPFEPLISSRL